jgi:hypothetical protein
MTPEERLAEAASKFESGNGEAAAVVYEAMARLAYRRRNGGKQCSSCREVKPLSAYGRDADRADGLAHRCRACDNTRKRESRTRAQQPTHADQRASTNE